MAHDDAGRSRQETPAPGRVTRTGTFDAFGRNQPTATELSQGSPADGEPRGSLRRVQWARGLSRAAISTSGSRPEVADGSGTTPAAEAGLGASGPRRSRYLVFGVPVAAALVVGLLALWYTELTSSPVQGGNAAQGLPVIPDVTSAGTVAANGFASLSPITGTTASGTSETSTAKAASTAPPSSGTTTPVAASVPVSAYVAELNSGNTATEQSAIAGLGQLMTSTPTDQPAVINALCSYLHTVSPAGSNDTTMSALAQKAIAVLIGRDASHDDGAVLKLDNTNLTGANLVGADLAGASAQNTDFDTDNLTGANLSGANLQYAYLGETTISGTDFASANLSNASFAKTPLCNGKTPTEPSLGYNCIL